MQPTTAILFSYIYNKACDEERAPPDISQIVDESSLKWASLTSIYSYLLFTNKITKKNSRVQLTCINLKLVSSKKLQKIYKRLLTYFSEKNIRFALVSRLIYYKIPF